MSVEVVEKDLLSVREGIILHGCNAQGVMGSGVAAQLRAAYPGIYEVYKTMEATFGLKLGQVIPWVSPDGALTVMNLITQQFYGRSHYRYVDYGAVAMAFSRVADMTQDTSEIPIYLPKIGSGLGGGDWTTINELLRIFLEEREVYVCVPPKPLLERVA